MREQSHIIYRIAAAPVFDSISTATVAWACVRSGAAWHSGGGQRRGPRGRARARAAPCREPAARAPLRALVLPRLCAASLPTGPLSTCTRSSPLENAHHLLEAGTYEYITVPALVLFGIAG